MQVNTAALGSTVKHESWNQFIADLFINIALGIAAAALPAGAAPATAFVGRFLSAWHLEQDNPIDLSGVNGFFAEYQSGQRFG